jgi:integrase
MSATSLHPRRRVAVSTLVPRRSDAPKGPRAALAVGRGVTETGLAFTNEDGRALTPGGVSQRFDRLVARHKIPPIRLHDLRHVMTPPVAATLALTAGVDIKVVSEQLGHTTTQITRDIYLSVMPQVAHAAAHRVGRAGLEPATEGL